MLELALGLAVVLAIALVLGHNVNDLYNTKKVAACTAEDYNLVK